MTAKITIVQCHGLRSALNSHSRAALFSFVARRVSRLAGHCHCSGAPRRWGMGTLSLPVPLLVKVAGSTHFPVFFCQRWEKGPNILPDYESKTPWRDCEKPSSRATLRRPPPTPISMTPLNQGELLPLLPTNLCLCLQDPLKKHTNPCAVSCSNSDGINIAWYLKFCLFKWGSPALWELWLAQWVCHFAWRLIGRSALRVNIAHRRRRQHCAAGCCVFTRCYDKVENSFFFFFSIVFVLFRWFTQMHNAAAKDCAQRLLRWR